MQTGAMLIFVHARQRQELSPENALPGLIGIVDTRLPFDDPVRSVDQILVVKSGDRVAELKQP